MSLVPKTFPMPGTGQPAIVFCLRAWQWDGALNVWQTSIDRPLEYAPVDPSRLTAELTKLINLAQAYLGSPPPYTYVSLYVVGPNNTWLPLFSGGNWERVSV